MFIEVKNLAFWLSLDLYFVIVCIHVCGKVASVCTILDKYLWFDYSLTLFCIMVTDQN